MSIKFTPKTSHSCLTKMVHYVFQVGTPIFQNWQFTLAVLLEWNLQVANRTFRNGNKSLASHVQQLGTVVIRQDGFARSCGGIPTTECKEAASPWRNTQLETPNWWNPHNVQTLPRTWYLGIGFFCPKYLRRFFGCKGRWFDEPANVWEFDSPQKRSFSYLKESKINFLVNLSDCQHSSVSIHQLEFWGTFINCRGAPLCHSREVVAKRPQKPSTWYNNIRWYSIT